MAHLTIVDAARTDTCDYPRAEILLTNNAFIRTDDYDRCGKAALKLIMVQDTGDRRAYCAQHVASAARVMRRMEVK